MICTRFAIWCGMLRFPVFDYITVTSQWAGLRLKSPASRLFTQPFIQTQINENITAPRHWPLYGEFRVTNHLCGPGTGEFPAQMA